MSETATEILHDDRPRAGPFILAVLSLAIAVALIIALMAGMPMTLVSALYVVIPGMIISVCVWFVSLGWIFIMYGRTKQTPRWLLGSCVLLGITVLMLFALTYVASISKGE